MVSFIQQIGRIQFGFGAIDLLNAELALLGASRPLLMTDQGVQAAGLQAQLLAAMKGNAPAAIFDNCPRHPTEAAVLQALKVFTDAGCDSLVALGGGAVIDLAKGVALLSSHGGALGDYSMEAGGAAKIRASVAPLIAIPTTAGTGSEVGRGAGIALDDAGSNIKAVFMSVNLVPKVALCDPGLTMTLPPSVTAGTGVDALSHCLEGFLSSAINPPVDAIACDGVQRLAESLPLLMLEPANRDARWNVMMGALQGGLSMWKGLGIAHALSIPLDAFDLHHGTLVGMLMPEAIRFARPAAPEKLARLDQLLGGSADEKIAALNQAMGLPQKLSQMGVPEHALEGVAQAASASVFNKSATRPASAAQFMEMLTRMY
ncbi:MAG: iron-containing alcohol dehydrogenase [Pseudomonadota bacterium]